MQSKLNKCNNCEKLEIFINEALKHTNSGYDLALDVHEFIKNCECEEKENESEEYDNG